MELPKKLINEFAKVTNDSEKTKTETTVYGVIAKNGDSTYAQLDGSDLLTPVSTTTDTQDGDRVTVLIKNHKAVVTGNMTSPAARTDDVKDMEENFDQEFESIKANYATITHLKANYANIDFANIGKAAMEFLYSESGLIKDVTISDGTITGNLVGVTIKGDLIEGNTVAADKLVILGEDGLYYKLNVNALGETTASKDEKYQNGLDGSVIIAKSITATKISVDDLVAFDATIGGFNITSDALYSGVKESINNTTQGIYLGKDGQLAIGDPNNFLKYYKTTSGSYKLELSLGGDDVATSINDAVNTANDAIDTANDAADAASDAAKTATNFLSYDSTNGLQVGNRSGGSWSGYRTQIKSDAFNIVDSSGTTLASYGEKLIELGKNSTESVISLCGDTGTIRCAYNGDVRNDALRINSECLNFYSTVGSVLQSSSSELTKSVITVLPDTINMYVLGGPEINMNGNSITLQASTVKDRSGNPFLSVYRGSSGTWEYRKWSNGDVELWGYKYVSSLSCATALGSMYRTDVVTTPDFPFTVYSPNVTATYESDGYGAILWPTTAATTTKPSNYYLVRPTSATINTGYIRFHVYGKWST